MKNKSASLKIVVPPSKPKVIKLGDVKPGTLVQVVDAVMYTDQVLLVCGDDHSKTAVSLSDYRHYWLLTNSAVPCTLQVVELPAGTKATFQFTN